MRDLAKADYPIVREERSRADAIRYYREHGEPFKVEILEALPADVTQVSFYRQGDFVDLCRGPHVPATGHIQAFKLLSSSGAYWRGDEHRPMLQRIYGTAWFTQEELDQLRLEPRGGEAARPPEARSRARPLHVPRRLARGALLAAQGHGGVPRARALRAGAPGRAGLPGDLDADPREQAALGAVGTLGALLGEHVQGGGRGAGLQPQAHELPRVDVRLPARAPLVPGPPAAVLGDGAAPPERALGHADRPVPRAPDHDGRRAHLLPAGSAPGGDHRRARAGAGVLPDVRARAALPAGDAAGEVPRPRGAVGPGRAGPRGGARGRTGCRSPSSPGTAPSTVRRSTSTSRTSSGGTGRWPPSRPT